jgi:excisionase family DNA binding protein
VNVMSNETQPLAHSIEQACRRTGVGRSTLYQEIKNGALEVCKVGDRTLIEDDELKRWLSTKRQRQASR